ncbi:MAG TPA: dihydrofolate reductase family protein [Mycobacteriales bacterium]|nr:dihydrofolate reductase family protein [Mycobacteriales bacterium]
MTEFVSLDGVFEDPGGAENFEHGGWTFTFDRGADADQFKLDELTAADAQLLGRVTYEGFAAAWPTMTDEAGFADRMNGMPKYVVSKTLASADWAGSTIIRENVAEEVTALKQRYAGDILVAGSGQLVQFLLGAGLVDRLQLMTFPIVLGSGRRLFPEGVATTRFTLLEARPVGPDGVTIQIYAAASAK